MNKPGQWVEIKQSELQQLRDELAESQGELKAIFQAVHGSDEGTCDSVIMEYAKARRDRLVAINQVAESVAHVVVLRTAMEMACDDIAALILLAEEYGTDGFKEPLEIYKRAIVTTPAEAIVRFRAVVDVLQKIVDDGGTDFESHCEAQEALAAWKGANS